MCTVQSAESGLPSRHKQIYMDGSHRREHWERSACTWIPILQSIWRHACRRSSVTSHEKLAHVQAQLLPLLGGSHGTKYVRFPWSFVGIGSLFDTHYLITSDQRSGYDRVRQQVIGYRNFELEGVEEAFTSENWLVRIYRVKPRVNRGVL